MRRFIFASFAFLLLLLLSAFTVHDLNEADLLFASPTKQDHITQVTSQNGQYPTPHHVGLFHRIGGDNGIPYVIEAIPEKGVCLTPVDSFLCKNQDCTIILATIAADIDRKESIKNALRLVGCLYDHYFQPSDSAIYCSELVTNSVVSTAGELVFELIPMSFHDENGKITEFWTKYYRAVGLEVPEGEPGSNPANLLENPVVKVFHIMPAVRP
ncbi:MAG: hypothetical protein J6X81_06215 [Muribaculaceae bacterium]|nr:hypothetical protein [Muribaculaceae bacterium]